MFELVDELSKVHVDTLESLRDANRDERLGDIAGHVFDGHNMHSSGQRTTCWEYDSWGLANWTPKALPISAIHTHRMGEVEKGPVEIQPTHAPSHLLVIETAVLRRLECLGLVDLGRRGFLNAYGDLYDDGSHHGQGGLARVSLTERGRDFITERKPLAFMCKWALPLGMRRRALPVASVCTIIQAATLLPWPYAVIAIAVITSAWHFGAVLRTRWVNRHKTGLRAKFKPSKDAAISVYVSPSAIKGEV